MPSKTTKSRPRSHDQTDLCGIVVCAIRSIRRPSFTSSMALDFDSKTQTKRDWETRHPKKGIVGLWNQKTLNMGSRNRPQIHENLSSQKMESTIVPTVLKSMSQVVSSHRRRWKTKRNRSGLAPLRCARTLQVARQASKK